MNFPDDHYGQLSCNCVSPSTPFMVDDAIFFIFWLENTVPHHHSQIEGSHDRILNNPAYFHLIIPAPA
jgi:hypothetical protein